ATGPAAAGRSYFPASIGPPAASPGVPPVGLNSMVPFSSALPSRVTFPQTRMVRRSVSSPQPATARASEIQAKAGNRRRGGWRCVIQGAPDRGSVRVGRDDFAGVDAGNRLPDAQGDAVLEEPDRAIGHRGVDASGVIAPGRVVLGAPAGGGTVAGGLRLGV